MARPSPAFFISDDERRIWRRNGSSRMGMRYDEPCSTWNDAAAGLAPMRLVIAALRQQEPVYEQPRLQLPLPTLPREVARIAPHETDAPAPTRGVNVFDMV